MDNDVLLMIMAYVKQRKNYEKRRRNVLIHIINAIKRRNQCVQTILQLINEFQLMNASPNARIRSCRRLPRNKGWWETVSRQYCDKRFNFFFRVSKETFYFLVEKLQILRRDTIAEEPISVEERLAVTLYRLGCGSYYHTLSEMSGIAESTICKIVPEVCSTLVNELWDEFVSFPRTSDEYKEKLSEMDTQWQFKYAFCAIDGSHLPIKCPSGGNQSKKSYHNFKNFYSVVLMAMVDAKLRFLWASCGFPGNSHDSSVFQSTQQWSDVVSGKVLPNGIQCINGDSELAVPAIILGDSAFPLLTWLLKPYGDSVPTAKRRYFNYRLSRSRIVSECAFGHLKGRFRILLRKCESSKDTVKIVGLACVLLHNICITKGDLIPRYCDLTLNEHGESRTSEELRDLLDMYEGQVGDYASSSGKIIRDKICEEFWEERQIANND